ncbi:hypothetical protein ACQEVF_56655 [Nonomuraea polychroma]|uniref:hypothetical protein n=1 Tax=Nonomuraea polychroma TaxID=46176 RepID=UPI003D8B7936
MNSADGRYDAEQAAIGRDIITYYAEQTNPFPQPLPGDGLTPGTRAGRLTFAGLIIDALSATLTADKWDMRVPLANALANAHGEDETTPYLRYLTPHEMHTIIDGAVDLYTNSRYPRDVLSEHQKRLFTIAAELRDELGQLPAAGHPAPADTLSQALAEERGRNPPGDIDRNHLAHQTRQEATQKRIAAVIRELDGISVGNLATAFIRAAAERADTAGLTQLLRTVREASTADVTRYTYRSPNGDEGLHVELIKDDEWVVRRDGAGPILNQRTDVWLQLDDGDGNFADDLPARERSDFLRPTTECVTAALKHLALMEGTRAAANASSLRPSSTAGQHIGSIPIDGWHRIYRAATERLDTLPAVLLTADEERRVRIHGGDVALLTRYPRNSV